MMVQRIVKEFFQQLQDSFQNYGIKDSFLVDVDFRSESFIYKAFSAEVHLLMQTTQSHGTVKSTSITSSNPKLTSDFLSKIIVSIISSSAASPWFII